MDCWRQWIRHRTASVNEYSTRYSLAIDSMQATGDHEWRSQATTNRQGSAGLVDAGAGAALTQAEHELQSFSRKVYEERLEAGIAREQARKDLPLSTYTEAYWKIDLHNLLHFLALRMDAHAQYEIRQYATVIGREIVRTWVPLTWEAFLDYRVNAMSFSAPEVDLLARFMAGGPAELLALLHDKRWLKGDAEAWTATREATEFGEKLVRLGITAPWA
jgi:thymidylate synthase (FAD)